MKLILEQEDIVRLICLSMNMGWYNDKCVKVFPEITATDIRIEDDKRIIINFGKVP